MDGVNAQLKRLLAARSGRIPLGELSAAWKEEFGSDLVPRQLGCKSLQALIGRCAAARVVVQHGQEVVQAVFEPKLVDKFMRTLRTTYCRQQKHVSMAGLTAALCQQLGVVKFEDLGVGRPSEVI